MDNIKKLFVCIFVSLLVCSSPLAVHCEENKKLKVFTWAQKDIIYQTRDCFKLLITSEAFWIIDDRDLFKHSVYDLKGARHRLDEIIPPAVSCQLATHKRNELNDQKPNKNTQKVLNKHSEEIVNLFQKVVMRFGIKVIKLKITLKDL